MPNRTSFAVCAALPLALAVGLPACKPRRPASASLKDADVAPDAATTSGLKDFALEPTGKLSRKLGARLAAEDVPAAGCAHAARYVITASPGHLKMSWAQNRGDLVDGLKAVAKLGTMSWSDLEARVTLPTYTFMACKGNADYPTLAEAPNELLGTLKARARALKSQGFKTTLAIASAEDALITPGILAAVKANLLKGSDIGVK